MKTGFIFVLFGLAASLVAGQPAAEEGRSRFCAVDLYVDSNGAPLAAYQIEITVTNTLAKIVGIEGGEHPAFSTPPVYDPQAMQQDRVIIAAFSTKRAGELPAGKTRVATLHLEVRGEREPECLLQLEAAGGPGANRISVETSYKQRSP